jgi:rubredoxin
VDVENAGKLHAPTRFKTLPKWRCTIYGYVYDQAVGDAVNVVKPGTPFEELPEDWRRPVSFALKSDFEKIE